MTLQDQFGAGWYKRLEHVIESDYFRKIFAHIGWRLSLKKQIYPSSEDVFKAFRLTPFENVKIVILGNGILRMPKDGNGLAYGVNDRALLLPHSLKMIWKEVEEDTGKFILSPDYSLEEWAKQGVLLLNTALTAEKNGFEGHDKMWHHFIQEVLVSMHKELAGVVYLLWGEHAQSYIPQIHTGTNFILTAEHPDGEFSGCKHFTKANEILTEVAKSLDKTPEDFIIKW